MTKVFLRPDAATIKENNGIGRVVFAQYRYLPQFDIELVGSEDRADVISGHTHDYGASRVDHVACHGIYWLGDEGSGEYNNWHREANKRIIAAIRRARVVTVPSNWVAMPFQRDMRINPVVIGHGIDFHEWTPGDNGGYVLYGKNREGDSCNSQWALELAQHKINVVSTFAPKTMTAADKPFHLTLIGELPSDEMREFLRRADVYLATTKETFGIQTLEAMACGVPVLGFDWGGTADIVQHKETGYLVKPGDTDGLLEGLAYIRAHRLELSVNARAYASNFTWQRVIERYARLYHELAHLSEPTGVAVVITCHNYEKWLALCVESVLAQSYKVDEIIIVDDGSMDDSLRIAETYRRPGVNVIFQPNSGVAAARNTGVASTRQPFIVCLDADDMLDPRYIEACRNLLMTDRGIGISWTGMTILRGDVTSTTNWGAGAFDWEWQAGAGNPPHTNIPTGAMFRRTMWERAGGYKQEHAPGEDAEFYTRGLSVGFTARAATDLPFFIYRDHGEGAHRRLPYKPVDTWHPWMRDREYPLAAPSETVPNVRSYSDPAVSVIVPVGPGHGKYLPDALESLIGQTMREWEVIVVNDGDDITCVNRFPFAKVVRASLDVIPSGPGNARNIGLRFAKAPLVLFLDADDQLVPSALAQMTKLYTESDGRYIYGNWQPIGSNDSIREAEYNPLAWLDFDSFTGKHNISVLMATDDARRIKFDETLSGWEDWDFFTRCALEGIQGRRLDSVTLYVRLSTDGRTGRVMTRDRDTLLGQLKAKFGGATMAKSCCGGNGDAVLAAKRAWNGVPPEKSGGLTNLVTTRNNGGGMMAVDPNAVVMVRMEFIGGHSGAVTYPGVRGGGRQYRAGRNSIDRHHNVHPGDVETLEASGRFRRVAPTVNEPMPVQAPQVPVVQLAAVVEPEPVKMAVGGPELEMAANVGVIPNAPDDVEPVQIIQTAQGPVRRKAGGPKGRKDSKLRDLPPIE